MARSKLELTRKQIQEDLLDQLERRGVTGEYYVDLIGDYMKMWDTKNELLKDIKERGVAIPCVSSAGTNIKKNESVDQLIKLNAQMLKLLDAIGIKPDSGGDGSDDEM